MARSYDSGFVDVDKEADTDCDSRHQKFKGNVKNKNKNTRCWQNVLKDFGVGDEGKYNIQVGHAEHVHNGDTINFTNCHFAQDSVSSNDQCKKDLRDLVVTDNVIITVKNYIGGKWRILGERLNISSPELDDIGLTHGTHALAQKRMAYDMLLLWKEKLKEEATVDKLVKALNAIGERAIAAKVVPEWYGSDV